MMVQLLVALAVRPHVAPWEALFQVLEKLGVDRHHIFKVPMLGAVLHH